ncbi:MAG TPA: FHA domain-containing protein [Gemmataceae bacterium]|nr:FHA domain-containing protein [Gemmataceae bacterium]
MTKCPFCGFDNEDGALFCEQCKSDLSAAPAPAAAPPLEAVPMAAVVEDTIPMAAVVEAVPVDPGVPMAAIVEAAPLPAARPVVADAPAPAAPPMPAATESAPAGSAAPPAPVAAPAGAGFPAGSAPKLVVIRGQKINLEFPIYPDLNFIGRADEKPVDIDLEDQEPPDRVWCSRQHAVLHWDDAQGVLTLEDLNSANGTFVNRARIHPGQKRQLSLNDVIQIGTVHLKVKV